MKPLLFSLLFFISALSFAQDKGSISGVLSDSGSIEEPLVLAKVSVKETGDETVSDENAKDMAKEIAKDHLKEDPKYYSKLKKMPLNM